VIVRISGPDRRRAGPAVDRRLLRSRALRMLRASGSADCELSIALVGEEAILQLNADYRGIARPTDVLSFSLLEGAFAEHRGALLGDIVIGVETAARQARAAHRSLDDEVARLLIHGMLHLLGHDHEEPEEERVMRAEQRRLWRAIRV